MMIEFNYYIHLVKLKIILFKTILYYLQLNYNINDLISSVFLILNIYFYILTFCTKYISLVKRDDLSSTHRSL